MLNRLIAIILTLDATAAALAVVYIATDPAPPEVHIQQVGH